MIPAGMKCVQTVMCGSNFWMNLMSFSVFSRSSCVRAASPFHGSSLAL